MQCAHRAPNGPDHPGLCAQNVVDVDEMGVLGISESERSLQVPCSCNPDGVSLLQL